MEKMLQMKRMETRPAVEAPADGENRQKDKNRGIYDVASAFHL